MARNQTITFTDPQAAHLKREAQRLGIPLADRPQYHHSIRCDPAIRPPVIDSVLAAEGERLAAAIGWAWGEIARKLRP